MRRILRELDLRDVLTVVSLAAVVAGLAMVYLPAALIVPGAVVFALCIWKG